MITRYLEQPHSSLCVNWWLFVEFGGCRTAWRSVEVVAGERRPHRQLWCTYGWLDHLLEVLARAAQPRGAHGHRTLAS